MGQLYGDDSNDDDILMRIHVTCFVHKFMDSI